MSDPELWLEMVAEARAKADRMRTTYARHMDQSVLEQHLSQLNADLAVGAKYIGQQRQIVANLKVGDRRAVAARQLLQEAEQNQAIFVAEADRLAKELAAYLRRASYLNG